MTTASYRGPRTDRFFGTRTRAWFVLAAMAFSLVAGVVQAGPVTFEALGPMKTFLRADSTDTTVDSTGLLLSSLFSGAILPGTTTITLYSTGEICFFSQCSGGEIVPTFLGVFSSSAPAALSAPSNLHRISNYMPLPSGATGFATGNTYASGLTTDIAEDFVIPQGSGTSFLVPVGAISLYLGIADSLYADNSDPNASQDPLGVWISIQNAAIPEPGTVGMTWIGLAALFAFGRKRRARHND